MIAPEVAALREALAERELPPVPVARAAPTPHRRRRDAAARAVPLPGMSSRQLRGRDPLAGLADRLAVEVEGLHTARLVGVSRETGRDLLADAGLRSMADPRTGCRLMRAADVDALVEYVLARGGTIIVRRDAGVVA